MERQTGRWVAAALCVCVCGRGRVWGFFFSPSRPPPSPHKFISSGQVFSACVDQARAAEMTRTAAYFFTTKWMRRIPVSLRSLPQRFLRGSVLRNRAGLFCGAFLFPALSNWNLCGAEQKRRKQLFKAGKLVGGGGTRRLIVVGADL